MENEKRKKDEWLPLRGAIYLCRLHGRNITKAGLIYIGKELNFIRRNSDGYHWEYETSKLLRYLRNALIPIGWISMKTFARKVGISTGVAYYILRKYQLKYERCGRLRGMIYVWEKDAIAAYQKHRGVNNVGKEKIPSLS